MITLQIILVNRYNTCNNTGMAGKEFMNQDHMDVNITITLERHYLIWGYNGILEVVT